MRYLLLALLSTLSYAATYEIVITVESDVEPVIVVDNVTPDPEPDPTPDHYYNDNTPDYRVLKY